MKTIQLTAADLLLLEEVDALAGRFLTLSGEATVDDQLPSTAWAGVRHVVRGEDTTVLKPDGTPLIIYCHNAVPRPLIQAAFATFKQVDTSGAGDNRGLAGGILEGADDPLIDRAHGDVGEVRGSRYSTLKKDGTLSNTTYSRSVDSAIAGYYDRYPRIPYCRMTRFTMDQFKAWTAALPFLAWVSDVFKAQTPDRWQAQADIIARTSPDFKIPGTVFTTATINRSWRTALHKDKGDYAPGFGVMTVMEGGKYTGGELIFPQYRCAVDMRTGGVCLADVHEWHGNAPIQREPGQGLRLSLVLYYREKMQDCGTAEEERARAEKWSTEFQAKRASVGQFPKPDVLHEDPVTEDTPPAEPPTAVVLPFVTPVDPLAEARIQAAAFLAKPAVTGKEEDIPLPGFEALVTSEPASPLTQASASAFPFSPLAAPTPAKFPELVTEARALAKELLDRAYASAEAELTQRLYEALLRQREHSPW